MLGDQIYIAALVEAAGKTRVGKTWLLERNKTMLDLGITDLDFDALRHQIEGRIPGKWNRASASDGNLYVYLRTA